MRDDLVVESISSGLLSKSTRLKGRLSAQCWAGPSFSTICLFATQLKIVQHLPSHIPAPPIKVKGRMDAIEVISPFRVY